MPRNEPERRSLLPWCAAEAERGTPREAAYAELAEVDAPLI